MESSPCFLASLGRWDKIFPAAANADIAGDATILCAKTIRLGQYLFSRIFAKVIWVKSVVLLTILNTLTEFPTGFALSLFKHIPYVELDGAQ